MHCACRCFVKIGCATRGGIAECPLNMPLYMTCISNCLYIITITVSMFVKNIAIFCHRLSHIIRIWLPETGKLTHRLRFAAIIRCRMTALSFPFLLNFVIAWRWMLRDPCMKFQLRKLKHKYRAKC